MVLGKRKGNIDGEKNENPAGGYTIGGDINIYEWDHESMMPRKQ